MRRAVVTILWLGLWGVALLAQVAPGRQLTQIFERAEQCYLMDDYQQLLRCIDDYRNIIAHCKPQLGDSLDVYVAYEDKMNGALYYGLADKENISSVYSEFYYLDALQVFVDRHDDDKANTLRRELAQLYYKMGEYDAALQQLDTVREYYDYHVNDLGITSEQPQLYTTLSQMAMCMARVASQSYDPDRARQMFDQALQLLDQALDYFKRQKHPDYAEALRKQGKILMMQHDRLGLADFSLAKKAYQQYVKTQCADVARRLGTMTAEQRAQYWLAIHQFLYDCYRLGNHAPDMLYDLALLGKGYLLAYEHNPKELQTTWKQVRAKLGRQDCAIEFVQYFARDDERRLGCLVLRHGSPKPVFVDLVAVDSLLETPVGYYDTLEDLLTSTSPFDKDILYTDSLAAHKVWSPQLMGLIAGARRVYFAPDGILHQWAIEYMIPDTAMVGYRLTSTRNLLHRRARLALGNALLCGGIDFNTPITPTATDNDVEAYRYLSLVGSEADSLPGSAEEVDSIYAFRNHPGDCVLKGAQATDEAFIDRVKAGYDIIHLSTHGYYSSRLGLTNDIKPLLSDNSMSRSGVLFAGANVTLTDAEFDENLSDGVLSSTELARLDFGRTSLIVLSACQSGLGRITDDGIYGLERGLKQGGAGAMALTLWSVYDLPSSMLMRYFYRNLIEMPDHDIHAALLRARKQLSEYRHTGIYIDPETLDFRFVATDFDAPRYTHPFILIDAF